ncbi:hypothetical protein M1L65_05925 [Slackia exigua]|uniref:hypothetical protein n=1 Tax=Slackia exigua TaxID=84109 RepID=UPI003B9FA505
MSSSEACTRTGSQEPRVRIEPDRGFTNGDNAAALSAAYANTLDAWQRSVLDCWLGRDALGRLTAMTCGLSVPRQNGKNGIIEAFEFFLLLNVPDTHILHTAHQVKTAKKAFNRLAAIFDDRSHREISDEVLIIRRTNGEEAITLKNGNTIEYSARSRNAARGFDAITCVIYDEAQELTDGQVEALMSTLAASPTGDRQLIYAGTPPSPESPGEVFRRRRDAAFGSPTPRTAWHEWGIGGVCPVDKDVTSFSDVLDMVYATNPAMGVRLSETFTEEEFSTMTPEGFARERLGWWSSAIDLIDSVIAADDWNACRIDAAAAPAGEADAFGVKFSPDGEHAAIAASIARDGESYIELVEYADTVKGIGWVVEAARKACRVAPVFIDGKSRSQTLLDRLEGTVEDGRATLVSTGDAISAASGILDATRERTLTHVGADGDVLSESARTSTRRPIGSAGGWGFGGSLSAPVEAAAIALWGARKQHGDECDDMEVYF